MATRMQKVFTDDLDGSDANQTVRFSVGGDKYEIDLSNKNTAGLLAALKPYMDAGRKVGSAATVSTGNGNPPLALTPEARNLIRQWARANPKLAGAKVGDRGRIPQAVIDQYNQAQDRPWA